MVQVTGMHMEDVIALSLRRVKNLSKYLGATMLVVAAACGSKQSVLTYKLKNMASDTVDVICVRTDRPDIADTFWVGFKEEVVLGVRTEGTEHVSTYKENGYTLGKFSRIDVYRHHGRKKSTTNFLSTAVWTYGERSSTAADYKATVTDKDF